MTNLNSSTSSNDSKVPDSDRFLRQRDLVSTDKLASTPVTIIGVGAIAVSYTHLRAHETRGNLVCRLLLEKKK